MTRLLGSAQLEALAHEESVRGVLIRMVLEQAEQACHEEQELLEDALQLLMQRFQVMEDDTP